MCTQDEKSRASPFTFPGTGSDALAVLAEMIAGASRTRIIAHDERYLHAEFVTRIFRFVDDVEFLVDEAAGVIHFRSASRVGRWDLGANRRRVERLRREFERRTRA